MNRDLYFTRAEMEDAWRAMRPFDWDVDLDTIVERSPLIAMLIRCRALALRRERQGLAPPTRVVHAFRLSRPRGQPPAPRKPKQPAAVPKPKAPTRPDAKQRAAHDVDLFDQEPA